ncbi:hypothetical protein F5Y09DRAFT_210492 [Xylaria sp. FL1042]|nr:hypothetical protein F5Y09DRAFT_210492 [Xylaria sp. FL1042]
MKFVTITLALVSAVVAQDLGALPDCAKNCLTQYTVGDEIGDCARLDAKCICASDAFIDGIACCLASVCDAADQQAAVTYARSFCATVGVTDLPQSVTCATTSPSSGGSGTSSTPVPTVSAAATTTTTQGGSGSTSATTDAAPSATVTPNAAGLGVVGSAGFYGGLLAALAIL